MLITCPECQTNYSLPFEYIETANKVRCLNCGHVWNIHAEAQADAEAEDILDIDALLNLPDFSFEIKTPSLFGENEEIEVPDFSFDAFVQTSSANTEHLSQFYQKWIRPLYYMSLFCIIVSISLYYFVPQKRSEIKLESFAFEMDEKDFKHTLNLSLVAFNSTQKTLLPKTFKVAFFDKTNTLLLETIEPSPLESLAAGETKQIHFKLERPPAQTRTAVVTLTRFEEEEIQDKDKSEDEE